MNSDGAQPDNLFPMPLSSMEKFHLYDSSYEFPNEIYGRLRFDGSLDKNAAIEAVHRTLDRQLILNLKIRNDSGKLNWIIDRNSEPPILFQDIEDTTIPSIDCENDYPWRVIFRTGKNQTEIWFQAAHALFDGLGAIQLITNWSNYYHQRLVPESKIKRLHRLDYKLLRKRNSLGLTKASYLKNLWKQPIALFGATKFLGRTPAQPFRAIKDISWDNSSQPAVIGVWVDTPTSEALREKSQELGVRLNSVFVGQLMKTLEKAASENPNRISKWLRIMHPMSIRTIADRKMPACNRTTVVQIDRQAADFDDKSFFRHLDREIAVIHGWELGKLFLLAIKVLSIFPSFLRRNAQSQKCRGSAVYANLGEPLGRLGFPVVDESLKVGNLELNDFDLVGPIRSGTPVNFSIQKHLQRYRLSLHYDRRSLTDGQAVQLLEQFQSSLLSIAR